MCSIFVVVNAPSWDLKWLSKEECKSYHFLTGTYGCLVLSSVGWHGAFIGVSW